MKPILLLLTICFTITVAAQDKPYFVYCNTYKDRWTAEKPSCVVYAIYKDSVATYISDIGYVWWKITSKKGIVERESEEFKKRVRKLEHGEFQLEMRGHTSYLIITPTIVVHLITLKPENISFIIEAKRKPN